MQSINLINSRKIKLEAIKENEICTLTTKKKLVSLKDIWVNFEFA